MNELQKGDAHFVNFLKFSYSKRARKKQQELGKDVCIKVKDQESDCNRAVKLCVPVRTASWRVSATTTTAHPASPK